MPDRHQLRSFGLRMKINLLLRALIFAMMLPILSVAQQAKPGIGLALAGGGAKGLAHIGILKAIDSAELNIDYITGTSMGSIVGGLYAAGYSGDSIEVIARNIDWNVLLSNSISMGNYVMEEKSEYGKYAVELPILKNKITLPSGFLESQELWLTLEKYFFPVAGVKNFDLLSIPYRCIGTDLASGEPVVFNSGSVVRSIRASMAIPGAFSPVDINGKRMVDGGITRNFPVKDLKDMGATYTIGVSVSTPIQNIEELDDAMTVLGQVIFLGENKDRIEQSKLLDLLISVPMGKYTSASFDEGAAIIDLGIEVGRKYYPYFKRLADSLKAANPNYVFKKNRLPDVTDYQFASVKVLGLSEKSTKAFLDQNHIDKNTKITAAKLERETRQAFAYRTYKSISYEVETDSAGAQRLVYNVKPESTVMLKVGINQNNFTGFGVHLNLTARNALTPFSRSMISLNLGQNFRALAEHLQMLGYSTPWSNRFQFYTEFQNVPTFTDFRRTGLYKLKYVSIDDRFQISAKRRSAGGVGIQWENISAVPEIESGNYFSGHNNYFQLYGFWQYNTLQKPQYPKKGTIAEVKAGMVFSVNPKFSIYEDGSLIGPIDPTMIKYGDYARVVFSFGNTSPLSKKWAFVTRLQGGVNFSDNQSLLNNFFAGGMNPTFRNQIMFAGLQEGELASESMVAAHAGVRLNPFGGLYATLQGSTVSYDFIPKNGQSADIKWVVGGGLTLAYDLPVGPIEFTMMLTNKTQGLGTYFNFGFPFKL
jgi:NTE family protein